LNKAPSISKKNNKKEEMKYGRFIDLNSPCTKYEENKYFIKKTSRL